MRISSRHGPQILPEPKPKPEDREAFRTPGLLSRAEVGPRRTASIMGTSAIDVGPLCRWRQLCGSWCPPLPYKVEVRGNYPDVDCSWG